MDQRYSTRAAESHFGIGPKRFSRPTRILEERLFILTRQCISHLDRQCVDAACASSLELLIRDGRLDAIVCMRSNDAIWGLPYDVFLFTFLQEMMAIELKVELGSYYHFAGSLHLYERHLGLANRIVESQCRSLHEIEMPPIDRLEDCVRFLAFEEALRRGITTYEITELSPYWRELAEVLHVFHASKNSGWNKALDICSPSNRYLSFLAVFAEAGSAVPS